MARLDMRGNFIDIRETTFVTDEWEILGILLLVNISTACKIKSLPAMKIRDNEFYHLIFWTGSINDPRLRLTTCVSGESVATIDFYNTLVFDCKWNTLFCCPSAENCEVYFINIRLSQLILLNYTYSGHPV